MDRAPLGRVRLWIGGLATGGVVLAHQLAYLTAAPDPHERAELLRTAGHGDWSLIVALATGLLIAGLAGFVRRGLSEGRGPLSGGALVARLVVLQGAAFLLLEVAERVLSGAEPLSLSGEPVIVLGVLVQAIVATVAAGLVKLLGRAVELWVSRRTTRRRPARRVTFPRPSFELPRFSVCTGSGDLRGPPHAAL